MNKVTTNRKATPGRLIFYQDIYEQVPITERHTLELKLNWIMKFLIWLHLAKPSDLQKYKTVIIDYESKFVKTIKHRQRSARQIRVDEILDKRAKEPVKKAKLKPKKLSDVELQKIERKKRKINEKNAKRGMLVYDSTNNPPLRGSIEMKSTGMKSS